MAQKKQTNGKAGDLQQLFKSAETSKTSSEAAPAAETIDTGRNLLRLLSQNDNNGASTNGAGTNKSNDDKTSASVQDFFAKAVSSGDGPSAFTSIPLVTQPPLPITVMPISQGLAHGMVPVGGYHLLGGPQQQPPAPPATTGSSGINPMVQRLMSNPGIHSVDAIEAEQRKSASPNQEQQVGF